MEYDVFISCKSEDYKYAEEVYEFLKKNGISAFLASKELRRLGESEYRRAISNVLKSANHMVVFASKAEYIDSEWVYYEWDWFVTAKLKKRKKGQIITILKGVAVDDINGDLWKYESFTFEDYKEKILPYVDTPAAQERRRKLEEDRKREDEQKKQQEEERRREENERKKKMLVDLAEAYCQKMAGINTTEGRRIAAIQKELGIESRVCPICETKNPLGNTYCETCGWGFSLIDGIEGAEYLSNVEERRLSLVKGIYEKTLKPVSEPEGTVRKYTVGGVSFEMVKVSGGTFTMGASEGDADAYDDEKPAHRVTLSPYWIGRTEVTQALWKAVMGSEPSYFKGDDLPVEQVSWEDCQKFVGKLGELTGARFALPTEAEWEYAARGGSRSRGCKYSGSDKIGEVAWYYGNSGGKTHPVGQKAANELGLYDMTGNVWEWCADWYGGYTGEAQTNPVGPSSASYRVIRGGSWNNGAQNCRVSNRSNYSPSSRYINLGLRLSIREQ